MNKIKFNQDCRLKIGHPDFFIVVVYGKLRVKSYQFNCGCRNSWYSRTVLPNSFHHPTNELNGTLLTIRIQVNCQEFRQGFAVTRQRIH
jgi:hypothetical protein